jgi:hypothetical protein
MQTKFTLLSLMHLFLTVKLEEIMYICKKHSCWINRTQSSSSGYFAYEVF